MRERTRGQVYCERLGGSCGRRGPLSNAEKISVGGKTDTHSFARFFKQRFGCLSGATA